MRKNKKTIRLTETEMVSMIERIVNEVKREKRRQVNESRYSKKRILQEKHQRLILESEGEMILADLEEMDENNPNPVIEKLKRHIEILKRKGGRELSDFMAKLDGVKDKLELAKRKVGGKFRDFFDDILGRNRLKPYKNGLKTGLRNNRRRPNNRSGKSQISQIVKPTKPTHD